MVSVCGLNLDPRPAIGTIIFIFLYLKLQNSLFRVRYSRLKNINYITTDFKIHNYLVFNFDLDVSILFTNIEINSLFSFIDKTNILLLFDIILLFELFLNKNVSPLNSFNTVDIL